MPLKNSEKPWAGLDLSASERGISAVAWGSAPHLLQVREARTDAELIALLGETGEVWVDAPLTQGEGPFRVCDRALHRCGISVLPLTWPAMRKLSERARQISTAIPHISWYETFPWAVYRSWGFRKKDLNAIHAHLRQLGIPVKELSVHACDAIAAWWVGWLKRHGHARALTGPDGTIWVAQSLLTSSEADTEM